MFKTQHDIMNYIKHILCVVKQVGISIVLL